jgi:hypothetical protein
MKSFHDEMEGTVQYDGSQSESSQAQLVSNRVMYWLLHYKRIWNILCCLAHCSRVFTRRHLVSLVLYGTLFNLARLRAKTRIKHCIARDLLFAECCTSRPQSSHTARHDQPIERGLQLRLRSLHQCEEDCYPCPRVQDNSPLTQPILPRGSCSTVDCAKVLLP